MILSLKLDNIEVSSYTTLYRLSFLYEFNSITLFLLFNANFFDRRAEASRELVNRRQLIFGLGYSCVACKSLSQGNWVLKFFLAIKSRCVHRITIKIVAKNVGFSIGSCRSIFSNFFGHETCGSKVCFEFTIMHHHPSMLIHDFLAKTKTDIIPQPPYSPDLAAGEFSYS